MRRDSPCTALDTCLSGPCVTHGSDICSNGNECTLDTRLPTGSLGRQAAQCNHTPVASFTPCGANGTKSCPNGVCL